MKNVVFIVGVALLFFTGCGSMIAAFRDVRKFMGFDRDRYAHFMACTPDAGVCTWLVSDSIQYVRNIGLGAPPGVAVDPSQLLKGVEKDFGQPVRVLFFEDGLLKSSNAVYCYSTTRFIRKRDKEMQKRFSVFPPQSFMAVGTLGLQLGHFRAIYPGIGEVPAKKYAVLIFWTLMMEQLSASAIATMREYIASFGREGDVAVILINTDRFWAL